MGDYIKRVLLPEILTMILMEFYDFSLVEVKKFRESYAESEVHFESDSD